MVLALESGCYISVHFLNHELKSLDNFVVHGYIAFEYPSALNGIISWQRKSGSKLEKEVHERFGNDKSYALGEVKNCEHTLVLSRKSKKL